MQMSSQTSGSEKSWEFSERSDSQRLAKFLTSAGNVLSVLLEEGSAGKGTFLNDVTQAGGSTSVTLCIKVKMCDRGGRGSCVRNGPNLPDIIHK